MSRGIQLQDQMLVKRTLLQKELLSNSLSRHLKSSFVIVTEVLTPFMVQAAKHFRSWSEGTDVEGKRMERSLKSDLCLQSSFWWSIWIVFNRERSDIPFLSSTLGIPLFFWGCAGVQADAKWHRSDQFQSVTNQKGGRGPLGSKRG